MTILMFNLLVGILSEKLGEIMATKTRSQYKLLLAATIEYETLRGVFYCKRGKPVRDHLVYATVDGEDETWDGQVKEIQIDLKATGAKI